MTANFLTEDSYLGSINEPLTLNRYNYCISSYPNYMDPSGNTFDPISEGQRLELMYLLTGDEEYSKRAEEQLRNEMEVTYHGARKSLSIIKDIFSGIGTSSQRNLRKMFEPIVVPTKALDGMFMGHGFDYSGTRDSYREETISFEKGRAAEAENLTAFYVGECIGDVLTVAIIMQCAKAATAGGFRGSMGGRNVMIANMVTADGTVVAVEVESGGAVVGVMGAFPDPGYGSGYGSGGVDDSFGNLWESIFGVKGMHGSGSAKEEIIGIVNDGAYRASKYSSSWQKASLQDAVNRFAPDAKPVDTSTGKTVYRNDDTGIEVVYDKSGNYFRINDTKVTGRRSYLDLNGNRIPNNVMTEMGTQRGMTQGEYNALTHFMNID